MPPFPVINLLLVTARPDEEKDVGYRTISRPLIEAIETAKLRVNVELLRPATYQALSDKLDKKGAGYYHIIHFDAHGSLMSYEQVQKGIERKRYTFQARWGREDIPEYEGVKAFLFLEGECQGKADPVEASELAGLLTGKGIPVCILNACQSGKERPAGKACRDAPWRVWGGVTNDSCETSLGSRLMAAGMQMVGSSLAVDIKIEFSDRFSQANTYHQLGNVAVELREYEQAKLYYQQALDIKIEFSDRFSQANTYHQLGNVAVELREYEQAKLYYQQALDIKIEFSDRFSQAGTYGQLGLLAKAQENYAEARVNLQTALEIFPEYQDNYWADVTRENLEQLPD